MIDRIEQLLNELEQEINDGYNTLPDYQTNDESKTYIPREDRKEFSPIGLVGKLRVNVGQTVGDRWIKMRDISSTVEEWMIR